MTRNSKAFRRVLAERFAGDLDVYCEYCGRAVYRDTASNSPNLATVDHRIPRARGGTSATHNIAIACLDCNHRKGILTPAEFQRVRFDNRARRLLISEITNQLRPGTGEILGHEAKEIKRASVVERHESRLQGRLTEPKPDCPKCRGTGRWVKRTRKLPPVEYACVCCVVDPRGFAAVRGTDAS